MHSLPVTVRLLVGAAVVFCVATGSPAVEIIGHRGASHDAPENTLASINLSWKQNADGTEIDVYLTRDGEIVAIHDDTTKRTAGFDKKVVEQSLVEIKSLDAGSWKDPKFAGEKIPTLSEVLATIPDGKRLFIEVKCGPEIVPKLKQVLHNAGKQPEQTAIISFSEAVVTEAKRAMPHLQVYLIAGFKQNKETKVWSPRIEELIEKAHAAKVDGLDLMNVPFIDAAFVQKVKRSNLGFYVWTVDKPEDAVRLRNSGVDGITTNRPAFIRETLQPTGN